MRVVVACRFFVQGERDRERVPPGSRVRLIQKSWTEQTSSIGASRGEQIEPAAASPNTRREVHVLQSCRGSCRGSDCRGCPEVDRRAFSKPKEVAGSQMRRGDAGRKDTTRQALTTWPQVPVAIESARSGWLTFQVISRWSRGTLRKSDSEAQDTVYPRTTMYRREV